MNEITVSAVIDNLELVTAFVEEQLEALDCPMKAQLQFNVAVDELFSNIALYAYPPKEGLVTVRIAMQEDGRTVTATFVDQGKPYNPLEKADPDITLSAEDRPIGGLGIFMVKKSMDAVEYEYTDGQNCLTLKKNL